MNFKSTGKLWKILGKSGESQGKSENHGYVMIEMTTIVNFCDYY